jgi:transglutaminase-like putative cysteine protease
MKSESKRADSLGQLALFLGFFLTVLFIVQCYASFGKGNTDLVRPIVAILISAAGCLVSFRLSMMLPGERTNNRRALIGTAMMVFVLYALIGLAQFTPLRERLQPWEFLILPICTFTFFLNSHLSFLILSITEGSILLWSLKDPSSFLMALIVMMAYTLALLLLFAVLHFRERQVDVPDAPPLDREIPLRIGPIAGLLLLDLFGLFLVVKPPAPEETAPAAKRMVVDASNEDEPLPGMGRKGMEHASITFDRDLKFGDLKSGTGDNDVLLMAQVRMGTDRSWHPEEVDFPLLWKMAALGEYDGVRWRPIDSPESAVKSNAAGQIILDTKRGLGRALWVEQWIVVSPMKNRGLFMVYPPKQLEEISDVVIDAEGSLLRGSVSDGPFKYIVYSIVQQRLRDRLEIAVARHPDARYGHVPEHLKKDPVFTTLANRLRAAPTHIDAVERAVALLAGYTYTRTPGLNPHRDPTQEFLRVKKGYCQHFASTMALLLRHIGIPARIGIGFSGGDWNESLQAIVVRRQHAHAWVEVYFETLGWLPFDPVLSATSAPTARSNENDPKKPVVEKAPETPKEKTPTTGRKEELVEGNAPVENPLNKVANESGAKTESFTDLWARTTNKIRTAKKPEEPGAAPSAKPEVRSPRPKSPEEFYARMATGDLALLVGAGGFMVAMLVFLFRKRRTPVAKASSDDSVESPTETLAVASAARPFLFFPRGSKKRQLVDLYVEFIRRAAKLGFGKADGQTAAEYSEVLRQCVEPSPGELDEITDLFEKARYSDSDISSDEFEKSKSAVKKVYQLLKSHRKA